MLPNNSINNTETYEITSLIHFNDLEKIKNYNKLKI